MLLLWNLKKKKKKKINRNELVYKAKTDHTDIDNKLMDIIGEGGEGIN